MLGKVLIGAGKRRKRFPISSVPCSFSRIIPSSRRTLDDARAGQTYKEPVHPAKLPTP